MGAMDRTNGYAVSCADNYATTALASHLTVPHNPCMHFVFCSAQRLHLCETCTLYEVVSFCVCMDMQPVLLAVDATACTQMLCDLVSLLCHTESSCCSVLGTGRLPYSLPNGQLFS